MTARPIRRNAQTPDRNGKIFYTSTTSLSHISKSRGLIPVEKNPGFPAKGIGTLCRLRAANFREAFFDTLKPPTKVGGFLFYSCRI